MKMLQRIFSILIILSFCWFGYAFWSFYSEETHQIEAGFMLFHSLILFVSLLTYRISLINRLKLAPITLLLLFGAVTLNFILWMFPGSIENLWTSLLALLALLFSSSICDLIQGSSNASKIIRYSVLGTGFFMSALIIFKVDSPILYFALAFLLIVVSLLSLFGIFGTPASTRK